MSGLRRHHYVARHYLRRWSFDGTRVMVVRLPVSKGGFPASVNDLAVESDLYAIETPDGRDQTVEREIAGPIDEEFAKAIVALMNRRSTDVSRADIATAVAFQFCRGPSQKAALAAFHTQVAQIKAKFSGLFAGEPLDEEALAYIVHAPEQNEWVAYVLASIEEMAGVFMSMRWHFLYFEEPVLVTSDSPITMWRRRPEENMPGIGPRSADEVRFPLTPYLALVMTWDEGSDCSVHAHSELARELNRSTCGQCSQRRFFYLGGTIPPVPRTEAEFVGYAVAADPSTLPPVHASQRSLREMLASDAETVLGMPDVAAELRAEGKLAP